jgi:hypothetical protein
VTKPDPSLLDDVVATKVLDAMKSASLARLAQRAPALAGLFGDAVLRPRPRNEACPSGEPG